jgi:hypothetical protein
MFKAGEIDDVRIDDMLAAEFRGGHPSVAEDGPETAFGLGWICSHFASPVAQFATALSPIVRAHTPHPPTRLRRAGPSLSPQGRGASH